MALPQMTMQQYADIVLSIWRELRDLPRDEREAMLDRILENLKATNNERQ